VVVRVHRTRRNAEKHTNAGATSSENQVFSPFSNAALLLAKVQLYAVFVNQLNETSLFWRFEDALLNCGTGQHWRFHAGLRRNLVALTHYWGVRPSIYKKRKEKRVQKVRGF